MIQLSLFRGVHDTQPRPVTLEEVVTMMRTDQSVRDLTEKHRYARATGDEQGASRYKKMMTSFGVAALFEGGRRQQHIVELTGLSLVDIDHIPAERMSEVRKVAPAPESSCALRPSSLLAPAPHDTTARASTKVITVEKIFFIILKDPLCPLGISPSMGRAIRTFTGDFLICSSYFCIIIERRLFGILPLEGELEGVSFRVRSSNSHTPHRYPCL